MAGRSEPAYVFAYGSLAELRDSLRLGDEELRPVPGRLSGFRRFWGVAMNNWEEAPSRKHFVDPETRQPPRVRVAFLDIEEEAGAAVNGLAIPVDTERLAALDLRERRYTRRDVSAEFDSALPHTLYAFLGREDARERTRPDYSDEPIVVSEEYLERVRRAFDDLGSDARAEFDRTTEPLRFPTRPLEQVLPGPPPGA
jgi:hypothetical protein